MTSQEGGSPWPEGILDIPVQDDLKLEVYEVGDGGGSDRFYRVYTQASPGMLAALNLRPGEHGGQEIDTLVVPADPSYAATTLHRLLVTKLFSEFSGVGPSDQSTGFSVDRSLATRNNGTLRAFYDFAFARNGDLIIPMPNAVVIRSPYQATDVEADRQALPTGFTGVFLYRPEEHLSTSVEEFYRGGQLIGRTVEVQHEDFMFAPATVTASDATGTAIELGNGDLHGTQRRVHFLKTLAEHDPELAELIVAG